MPRGRVLIAALAAALLAPAAAARAVDFNVGTASELTAALATAAANGSSDRILLPRGTLSGTFFYGSSENLDIEGQSRSASKIAASGGVGLTLANAAGVVRVEDVGFAVGPGATQVGVKIDGPATLDGVGFAVDPAATNASPIEITGSGATVQDATIASNPARRGSGPWARHRPPS